MKKLVRNYLNISNFLLLAILINISFLFYTITNVEVTDISLDYYKYGQLVQPFSVHRLDRYMDFYNVNYHALNKDFYSGDFRSVYSEIFRLFSMILTPNHCINTKSSLLLKNCDAFNFYLFYFILITINIYFLYKKLFPCENKFLWTILFSVSFPLLYSFERGNYIIISMLLINFLAHFSNKLNFYLSLFILPFTKIYLISTYFLLLIKSFSKFVVFLILFLFFNLLLFILFNDNPFLLVENLFHFDRNERVYEISNATSFLPLFKSYNLRFLSFLCYILYFSVLVRAYIYLNAFISNKSKDFNDLLFVGLLILPMIIPSVGFYFLILLYPFFAKYIGQGLLKHNTQILIVLMCIPYPINLVPYKLIHSENFILYIQLQSIIIPFLLLIIFYEFTKEIKVPNEN
jgi:hypothetical protein